MHSSTSVAGSSTAARGTYRGSVHIPARSRARTVLVGLLLTCWLVLGGAVSASAHTQLLSTDPAEGSVLQDLPLEATFQYSDEISSEFVDAALVAPGGAEPVPVTAVVEGSVVHVPVAGFVEPADGQWQAVVRVVSADGHPVEHTLTFVLDAPVAAEPTAPQGDGGEPSPEQTPVETPDPTAEPTPEPSPAPSATVADPTDGLDEEPGNPLARLVTGPTGAVLGGLALLAAIAAAVVHLRRRP